MNLGRYVGCFGLLLKVLAMFLFTFGVQAGLSHYGSRP